MRLTAHLPNECLMGNYCTRWRPWVKGLSLDVGRADFSKNPCDVSFKKGLSNEPTFSPIHLAGQYLLSSIAGKYKVPKLHAVAEAVYILYISMADKDSTVCKTEQASYKTVPSNVLSSATVLYFDTPCPNFWKIISLPGLELAIWCKEVNGCIYFSEPIKKK